MWAIKEQKVSFSAVQNATSSTSKKKHTKIKSIRRKWWHFTNNFRKKTWSSLSFGKQVYSQGQSLYSGILLSISLGLTVTHLYMVCFTRSGFHITDSYLGNTLQSKMDDYELKNYVGRKAVVFGSYCLLFQKKDERTIARKL
jgi:hypothetical protein